MIVNRILKSRALALVINFRKSLNTNNEELDKVLAAVQVIADITQPSQQMLQDKCSLSENLLHNLKKNELNEKGIEFYESLFQAQKGI